MKRINLAISILSIVTLLTACGTETVQTQIEQSSTVSTSEEAATTKNTEQSSTEIIENTETKAKETTTILTETTKTEITTMAETTSEISKIITEQNTETPEIKINSDYKKAYSDICKSSYNENPEYKFNLVFINEDETPELVVDLPGYYISLYTYKNGEIHNIMDKCSYGVSGNAGYIYSPWQNLIFSSSTEFAGIIRYETYMKINSDYQLENINSIKTCYYEDTNGNDTFDEGEMPSATPVKVIMNGKEVSPEEADVYTENINRSYLNGELTYQEICTAFE